MAVGGAASAPSAPVAANKGSGSRGGPPPPPPPPPPGGPGSLLERPANLKPSAPAGPNMNALFAELNKVPHSSGLTWVGQGEAVTVRLRECGRLSVHDPCTLH